MNGQTMDQWRSIGFFTYSLTDKGPSCLPAQRETRYNGLPKNDAAFACVQREEG